MFSRHLPPAYIEQWSWPAVWGTGQRCDLFVGVRFMESPPHSSEYLKDLLLMSWCQILHYASRSLAESMPRLSKLNSPRGTILSRWLYCYVFNVMVDCYMMAHWAVSSEHDTNVYSFVQKSINPESNYKSYSTESELCIVNSRVERLLVSLSLND